jgi:hypothetical protein
MPIVDDDLLSAVSAGAESVNETPAPVADEEVDTDEGSLPEAGESDAALTASDDSAEGEAAPEEGAELTDEQKAEKEVADKAAADKAAADKAAERGPDGKFVAKDKAPKTKDPVNDPIPNELKKETRERIQTLVATVKSTVGERDKAVAQNREILGYIEETKATPQQYGDALNYLKMVNSGDPTQMEQALTVMQREVEALAKMLGKPVPGVDMLTGHADLQQEVTDGRISQERAEELAAARHRQSIQTHQVQQRQQAQQSTAASDAAIAQGRAELNAVGVELSSDPNFAAKNAVLVAALKPVIGRAHPSDWATIYKTAYAELKLPTAPRGVPRTQVPANQPMRAKTPAGGAAKAPASLLEAIDFGIANAR